MEKLGGRFGKGRAVATRRRRGRLRRPAVLRHPAGRGAAMTRIAVLSDVHGNASALEAVRTDDPPGRSPTSSLVAGDLVLNGPDPAAPSTCCACWRPTGRSIVSGNTDIAVADFDYAAAFPWMTDGVPGHRPRGRRVGARRAGRRPHRLAAPPPGRAPAARRRRHDGPRLPRLARLADRRLRPGAGPERHHRAGRADGRPGDRVRPHPLPEVRDLGWKIIVNAGSAGYVFDGDPTASWALIDIRRRRGRRGDPADGVRRAGGRQRDLRPRPAGRRLSGRDGPHGEAGPMTPERPRRVVVTGMGMRHRARQRRRRHLGRPRGGALRRAHDPDVRPVAADRRGSPARSGTSTPAACSIARTMRRTDRYIQFGLVAAREALDQAGLPERLEGELAERTGVILGTGLGGVGTLFDGMSTNALRGPDRISPFLIPMGIPNVGAGQVAINFGHDRPQLRDRVGLCDRRSRPRRGVRDHPPRRRRHHDRGRHRGGHLRAARRRLRRHAGAVDPQRRPASAPRGRSTPVATASSAARVRAS